MNTFTKLAVACILTGTVLLAGPVFGFSSFAADRGVHVTSADDQDAYLSLYDNTPNGLGVNKEGDTAAIYDLVDRNSEFGESDFTADVARIEDSNGNVMVDPPLIGSVTGSGDDFQLQIECDPNDNNGVSNDDYLVTVDLTADSGSVTIDLERQTNERVSIKCQGEEPYQPPFFTVDIVDGESDSVVEEGEQVTVTADITNGGDDSGTKDVWLEVDGNEVDRTSETIGPGSTERVSLTWQTETGDAGDREIVVATEDDDATRTVTVREELVYDITIVDVTESAGGEVDVTVDVDTNDPAAEVLVQAVRSKNGNIKGSERAAVEETQPQTITLAPNGNPDQIRAILYDGNGDERARDTEPY